MNIATQERPYRLPAELIPGVPWPADFREDFNRWATSFFGRAPTTAPAPAAPVVALPAPETVAAPAVKPKATRPSRSKTQVQPDAETLSDLLDGLDDSFATLQIPAIKGNWLPKADIRALHKMGVYIPTPWLLEMKTAPSLSASEALPALASCMMVPSKHDTESKVHPRFAFAIKAPRLPENVEQFSGTAYRFGYCVQLRQHEHDKNSPPRLFWVWAWVVVGADGALNVPRERRQMVHSITHRRAKEYKTPGSRASSFNTHQWVTPTAFRTDQEGQQEQHENFLLCVFRQLVMWWNRRADSWSVGVRKDGRRVTFSIAPQHTAAYFADRDKTAAVDGTAKKIIHYVREHERANGQTVKAHVRGLRSFSWRSFECNVTAPNLNGVVATVCPIAPVEVPAKHEDPGMISTEDFAGMAANHEDFADLKKPATARLM